MKYRSCAVFIVISTFVVLTISASTAQDALTQADETAITTPANPVPLINQPLVPGTKAPGSAGFPLTVNGTGFLPGATVKWNGSVRATTFVSKSKLTAAILASDVATPKTAQVTVVNPGPRGGTSNVVFFEVTLPTSAAAFGASSLSPFFSPLGVATADFNRDGKLDLAVANIDNNNVSVLLGNGNGTFQGALDYPVGNSPFTVVAGDFNGDGNPDLAVGYHEEPTAGIQILLGNGDGTFRTAANYSVPCCPSSIAVGDFNEDGKLDLVAATDAASVLLGNGDGTFQPVLNYPAGSNTATVAVGDFNRDGHLDLAVANYDNNNVSVLLGNGNGAFQGALDYPVGNAPFTVVAGDFNGDGILDLAVTNTQDNTVSILLGNGNGDFQSAVNYSTATGPWGMTLGDFNGDGKLDLAIASGLTQILFGNGNGTFRPAADYGTEQSNPNSLAAADFTGQGRLDLVVAVAGASSISEMVQSMLAPSAADVTFPLQVLKTSSAAQKVTLTNVGTQLINVKSIAITGPNATDFTQTDTCGLSLAPRASCTINNTFFPRNLGPRTASITITDSAVGSRQSIALQGIGVVTGSNATLSTTSLSISCGCHFPPLPPPCGCRCSYSPITLSDFGKTDLSITGIGTTSLFTQTNTCDGSLKPGNGCTITVGLRGHGSFTGTLNINDNAPGSPQVVNLMGSNSCRFP